MIILVVVVVVIVVMVVRFNAREKASERMAGICIERERERMCAGLMVKGNTTGGSESCERE